MDGSSGNGTIKHNNGTQHSCTFHKIPRPEKMLANFKSFYGVIQCPLLICTVCMPFAFAGAEKGGTYAQNARGVAVADGVPTAHGTPKISGYQRGGASTTVRHPLA